MVASGVLPLTIALLASRGEKRGGSGGEGKEHWPVLPVLMFLRACVKCGEQSACFSINNLLFYYLAL